MIGLSMAADWRTIQMFISADGVFEVTANSADYSKLRCTCPSYRMMKKCKHTKHIKRAIERNEGKYAIALPSNLTDEEVEMAMENAETFRDLIVHYARPEVIK